MRRAEHDAIMLAQAMFEKIEHWLQDTTIDDYAREVLKRSVVIVRDNVAEICDGILSLIRTLEANPPAWENNDVIPRALEAYLQKHNDGLHQIAALAISAKPTATIMDIVEAMGRIDGTADFLLRCHDAAERVLMNAASAAIRDSAMLALISLDLPCTKAALSRALLKETNKILRIDLTGAIEDLEP